MFDQRFNSQADAAKRLIPGLDQVAAQRQLTPIENQLVHMERQNRQLIKMLVDSENLKRDKIIVCAACFEKIQGVDKVGTK